VEITCPRCGARQPESSLSFECVRCGADLASRPAEPPPPTPLHPGPDRNDLRVLRSGRMGRAVQALLVIGVAAAVGYVVLRFLPELFIDDATVGRAMDDTPAPAADAPPVLRNELPPERAAGLPAPATTSPPWPVPGAGIVRGRVTWQRVRPPPVIPFLVSDPACGVTLNVPRFVTGELGGVEEALVVVIPRDVKAPVPPPGAPLSANLRACLPRPRLVAGPPGTKVILGALGSATHQLVASAPLPGLPAPLAQGGRIETELPHEGTVFVTDPAHPWERFTLVSVPSTLWSTVNAEGFFRIDGVPPGPATVRFYTEGTGPFDREVNVAPGGEVMLLVDVADETPGFRRLDRHPTRP
jgi:hypothetical protein